MSSHSMTTWSAVGVFAGIVISLLILITPAGASHKLTNVHKGTGATACFNWAGDPNHMGAGWHGCWHKGEGSTSKPSVDLSSSGGAIVKWRQSADSQGELIYVVFRDNVGCQGVRVDSTTPSSGGQYPYKHIVETAGVINSTSQNLITLPGYYEYWRQIGTVASSEPECPAQWSAAHLHQQLNDTSLTWVYQPASNPASTAQMYQLIWH